MTNYCTISEKNVIIIVMASQITHLAIAKKYLEKHPREVQNVQAFLDGNVLPDLDSDKAVSHYGVRTEKYDVVKRNAEKVNPAKFAELNDLNDDKNRGIYLHLYVDYQFYNVFLLDYFKNVASMQQTSIDLYEATRRDDIFLEKKYGVSYFDSTVGAELQKINDIWDDENAERRCRDDYQFVFPYSLEQIDEFINEMSEIDIPQ